MNADGLVGLCVVACMTLFIVSLVRDADRRTARLSVDYRDVRTDWKHRRAWIIAESERLHRGYLTTNAFRHAISKSVIYDRDRGISGICHRHVRYADAQVDHVVPLHRGGEHSPRNVQIAHSWCNQSKGDRLPFW